MDFNYSEEQEAVRQLAGQIFGDRSTHERLKQIEAAADDDGPFDRELWKELADAGLLGIHLGEDVGGAGLDFVAACLVVEAAGRTAAYVPVVETMVYGALPLDRFGTDAQRKTWLTGVASGETILTAAMAELVGEVVLPGGSEPVTTATAAGGRLVGALGHQGVRAGRVRGRRHPGSGHLPDGGRRHHRCRRLHRGAGRRRRDPDPADDDDGASRGHHGARRRARRRRTGSWARAPTARR